MKELEQIEKLEKELAVLREIVKNKQKWSPKGGKWNVSSFGSEKGPSTELCRQYGIEFETEQAAEKAYKDYRQYHRLYKLAEELNEGWEPDFTNPSQPKFYIIIDMYGTYTIYEIYHSYRIRSVYFKSEEIARKAIEIIENGGLD